ncbi:histidine kinase [Halobaculum magnesiiphilum]|uniref:Histidine kinase n=1 Tax=Halobaculum magnesiiphilum TaxID=1017351 RepID=A0A8T8WGJ0_9EURY|nr:histidine kinase [Halobaculum magnesiiphilum]QZP38965.1 histidine kinase [Halobaculum magnesiiphilum]
MILDAQYETLASVGTTDRRLAVIRRDGGTPLDSMLGRLFEDQPVSIATSDGSGPAGATGEDDVAVLVEDGEVVATSPLAALERAILLVNSDLYTTGTIGLADADLPAVLTGLADVPFRLRGYPLAHKETLLLIAISRQIELRARRADGWELHSSFQRLSRIDDEVGTRRTYERLADSGVDVHVYGEPDWDPETELDVTAHCGYGDGYSDSWFVVFDPPAEATGAHSSPAGLLALEDDPRIWRGIWTYRPDAVAELAATIRREL